MLSKRKELYQLTCQQCGIVFLRDQARGRYFVHKQGWRTWYFCNAKCKTQFVAEGVPKKVRNLGINQSESDRKREIDKVVREISERLGK